MCLRPGSTRLLVALVVAVLVWPALAGPASADDRADTRPDLRWLRPDVTVRYEAPVSGEVLRRFAAPQAPLGAGHRGVDLAAHPADTVRAAADGRVTFAGPVAGARWVSIVHDDGVTTTYGPLSRIAVTRGRTVTGSSVIGRLATGGHGHRGRDTGLHWGARVDGRYVDPLGLLGDGLPRPSLVGGGGWVGSDHAVTAYEPWSGGRFGGLLTASSPVARGAGFAVAPNANHLVVVPGLASSSSTVVLDTDHLGYDPRSVTHFSYAGRHDERGPDTDPRRDQLPQRPADTWASTAQAAARLADQLRAQAIREPGRPVDLLGHSLGGVVVLRYLVEHHDPYDPSLPAIGHVVTVASPLDGSDLASMTQTLHHAPLAGEAVGYLQRRGRLAGDLLPLGATSIGEMAVGSDTMWDLAAGWERTLDEGLSGPLAMGTRMLNIGASRDLAVSSARTRQPDTSGHLGMPGDLGLDPDGRLDPSQTVPGPPRGATAELDGRRVADHRVLPGGHESVLGTEAMREVTWRFLAGEDVVDAPGHLSRIVGGQLADSARVGVELYSLHGPLMRALRSGERALPYG